MGIKFLIECSKCGVGVEKEIPEEGNSFIGIAENGFVIKVTDTFPEGWSGISNKKILCPFCSRGLERPENEVEISCQRCKKVQIIISLKRKNIKEDIYEEIRRVTSVYEFEEYEPMKFYCHSCAKEVKNEKTNSSGSPTSR